MVRGSRTPGSGTPFRFNAHVLRGFDPLPIEPPHGSPETDHRAEMLGSHLVRLQGVGVDEAEGFTEVVGRVGGEARTAEAVGSAVERADAAGAEAPAATPAAADAAERVDLWVAVTFQQVEAIRAQLLAAQPTLSRMAEEMVAALHAYHRVRYELPCGDRVLRLGEVPRVMGIVNCTPDSFYAGSRVGAGEAVELGLAMVEEGADLLDVGGESTRPGSDVVEPGEEIDRVVPVIEELAGRLEVPVSVDTRKAEVAVAALEAGATMVNDVSGLTWDPELGEVVADAGVPIVLMHTRGTPERMYDGARYADLVGELVAELRGALQRAADAGVDPGLTLVDPGIGFAKVAEHSLMALRHLACLRSLGRPLLVGPSRKSFIASVLDLPAEERLFGTAAAVAASVLAGAHVVRVHDVAEMRQVARVAAAIRAEGAGWSS